MTKLPKRWPCQSAKVRPQCVVTRNELVKLSTYSILVLDTREGGAARVKLSQKQLLKQRSTKLILTRTLCQTK